MGACNFGNIAIGKDAATAYRTACDDARSECECDEDYDEEDEGYNGTISTTDGFKMVTDAPRYGTKAFAKYEDKKLESSEKRDCFCIEVTGQAAKEIRARRGAKRGKVFYFFGWASE